MDFNPTILDATRFPHLFQAIFLKNISFHAGGKVEAAIISGDEKVENTHKSAESKHQ